MTEPCNMTAEQIAFDLTGFDQEIGHLLRDVRKRRRMTQVELAERIGVGRAGLASIESGRQRVPVDILFRASIVLKVKVSALIPEPA